MPNLFQSSKQISYPEMIEKLKDKTKEYRDHLQYNKLLALVDAALTVAEKDRQHLQPTTQLYLPEQIIIFLNQKIDEIKKCDLKINKKNGYQLPNEESVMNSLVGIIDDVYGNKANYSTVSKSQYRDIVKTEANFVDKVRKAIVYEYENKKVNKALEGKIAAVKEVDDVLNSDKKDHEKIDAIAIKSIAANNLGRRRDSKWSIFWAVVDAMLSTVGFKKSKIGVTGADYVHSVQKITGGFGRK